MLERFKYASEVWREVANVWIRQILFSGARRRCGVAPVRMALGLIGMLTFGGTWLSSPTRHDDSRSEFQ